MAGQQKRKNEAKPDHKALKKQKREQEHEDFQKLQNAVTELDVKKSIAKFSDLPLSTPTARGLETSHFIETTDIQGRAIPLALKGNDILGAAKTGSGKTLAFLIPVLEKLYRERWTEMDGLGALIMSPTRELAVQIFEVLRKIGRYHTFSAALVIGGKNLKEEAERLYKINIVVCTPGRLLQNLEQTAGFAERADNLQILVLDEADRIMDMGFQRAVDSLIDYLPRSRQTLLFSATQSRKVSDLARLSMKDPEYVAVHQIATPKTLSQFYLVTPLPEKLDTLYGFIKSNLKTKMVVFLSSGKQVRFVYESFRRLQPGIPLLHLHGRQKQLARIEIVKRFTEAQYSCLFATDVVARGIDFPAVGYVVQVDCPEDVDTYIHRVGRTARYERAGRAVLFMDPSEQRGFLKRLEEKKVGEVQKVNIKEKKKQSITAAVQDLCFKDRTLKYLGQKAFISYTRSISLQKDTTVFDLNALDLEGYAESLGLPEMPPLKLQSAEEAKRLKNRSRAELSSDDSEDESDDGSRKRKRKGEVRTKYDKMFERSNQDVLSKHYASLRTEVDDDDDFFPVKRVVNNDELEGEEASKSRGKVIELYPGQEMVIDSKRREKLLKSKKQMLKFKGKGTKLIFDDEGEAHQVYELQNEDDFKQDGSAETQRQNFVEQELDKVREADVDDKQSAKQKRQEKKAKRKERERMEREGAVMGGSSARLETSGEAEEALDFLRSLPVGGESDHENEDSGHPSKKAKKWFENDSDNDNKTKRKGGRRKVIEVTEEPDTLEDLEALATGLLDD